MVHNRLLSKNMVMGVKNTLTDVVYEMNCRDDIWLKYTPNADMALILDDQSRSRWEIQLE